MAEKKIQSIFLIEPSLKERAKKFASEQGISYAELVRKAVLDYVGGDLTTEDEIREIKKQLDDINKRLTRLETGEEIISKSRRDDLRAGITRPRNAEEWFVANGKPTPWENEDSENKQRTEDFDPVAFKNYLIKHKEEIPKFIRQMEALQQILMKKEQQ